ncbi:LLM class flavin-dependent oxidoreductase [Pseudomonas sp. S31]|uniref:LLM class flavin-dependent oxidoreductase n=1 Tax=Pseudomonas sp. S31 TaxID=1564473 RepID=UPI0019118155|nr:LLM class flavin-dependent oxidoreductase [Pseudomonas sp. S31]MBK4999741.1 LLM class flavin-dependent oxidoreductase [Pseudomonas sp. S31]
MPIEIRGRIPFNGKTPLSDTPAGRYAAFFIQADQRSTADSQTIIRAAREQEALGYDSSLIPTNSSRPDVWACCGWALAATRDLHLVGALRIGWQQPTLAARTLATLSQLSAGRLHAHLLQGRTDEDMRRDGDLLDKAQRYARSEEYLEIFKQTLHGTEPFDYQGEFYRVQGAFSTVKPIAGLRLHFPGGSPVGKSLAARHADVWAVAGSQAGEVAEGIAEIKELAQGNQRQLAGFWAGAFNVILAPSDEQAWAKAVAITREVERFLEANPRPPAATPQAASDDFPGGALYLGLSRLTGHGPSLVGSPERVAQAIVQYYRAGVTCITLGGLCEYQSVDGNDLITTEDRELLAHLIRLTRQYIAAEDTPATSPLQRSQP